MSALPNPSQPPFVRMSNLTKRFGDGPVIIDGINLNFDKGEFVSLIGPSGCGKSTLLRLIAGLSPITGGELVIDGMTPDNAREEMAFIFQEATLLPWLTVRKNIEVPLRLRGIDKHRRAETSERLLKLVGLDHVANYYPQQLSGGMKMRVSIARALSLSPKVLLLDEPFGALDEMTRDHLNEELLSIRAHENWTAFFVTHSVAEAVFLSTRIVVLSANPGRVSKIIDVPFPFPRAPELRFELEFQKLVAEVSGALHEVER
jgi:NitT/TauT family transport system ATP-binding protein